MGGAIPRPLGAGTSLTAMTCDNRLPLPNSHLKGSVQPLRCSPPRSRGRIFPPPAARITGHPRFVLAFQTTPTRARFFAMQSNAMQGAALHAHLALSPPPPPRRRPSPVLTLIRTRASMMEVKECRSSPSAMVHLGGGVARALHSRRPMQAPRSIAAKSRAAGVEVVVGKGEVERRRWCACSSRKAQPNTPSTPPLL